MILKHIGPTDKHVKSAPPLHINPVKQYIKFNVAGHVSLVVKISLNTPFCGCCGKCSIEQKLKKDRFWSVFLYILILFCLKNVHCLRMNDS